MGRLSVLLLCDDNPGHANTLLDHISGLRRHSRHVIHTYNPRGLNGSRLLDLDEFDVVAIHWSLVVISDHYLAPAFREKIARFDGPKVQFIQDDYRWVDQISAMMRFLGINLLFTLVPQGEVPKIWTQERLPGVRTVTTLAGYVPDSLVGLEAPPHDARQIDVGYRGRVLPYQLGRVGQEKVWIGRGFLERSAQYGLRCDIAWGEADRIYGERWNQFIRSCRAMLGTESGATITDFDGSLERRVQDYLASHANASFDEVEDAILRPYENNVRMTIASPRIFEAVAWRTALVQFPGQYSDVVRPWVHYIPLERDFSNIDEVVRLIRDTEYVESMTGRAYADVIGSGKYLIRTFVRQFDALLTELHAARSATRRVRLSAVTPGRLWRARHEGRMADRVRAMTLRYRLARVEVALTSPVAYVAQRFGEARARRLALAAKGYVAADLILQTPALRRVLVYWLTHPPIWRRTRFGSLLRDLLKIGIIRQAQRGSLTAGEHFVVVGRIQGQNVVMSSQRPGLARPDDFGWTSVERGLRSGTCHLIWDHSAVGLQAWYRLHARKWIAVGSEGGRNELTSIDPILEARPDLIADALRPPMPGDIPEWFLRPRVLLTRSAPAKAYVALALALGESWSRRLLMKYLSSARARRLVGAGPVLRDLAKLVAHARLSATTRSSWSFDAHSGTLEIRLGSRQEGENDRACLRAAILGGRLRRVVWDHSPLGARLLVRGGGLAVGFGGKSGFHELDSIRLLDQVFPVEVWAALRDRLDCTPTVGDVGEVANTPSLQ